jgi:hypothetical protein
VIYNKLEQSSVISDKKNMFRLMKEYYGSVGKDIFEYLPTTFHVSGKDDPFFVEFESHFRER